MTAASFGADGDLELRFRRLAFVRSAFHLDLVLADGRVLGGGDLQLYVALITRFHRGATGLDLDAGGRFCLQLDPLLESGAAFQCHSNRLHLALFDVCADDHCQRFQGVTKIISDAAFKAVDQTKGIALLSNGVVCDARYSKCCGGLTESFENVWEPVIHPYLVSVVDYKFAPENFNLDFSDEENSEKWIRGNPHSFCNTSDRKILSHILVDYDRETKDFFRWKVEYSQEELSSLIKEKSGIDFGDILDLIPVERGESSRIVKLKIVGTKRTITVGKELEIRRFLSKSHLYSSAFIVKKIGKNIPEKFILYGAGWGHGVGLCQIGAAVMAEKGYNFDEILLHYFKNSELKKIY